MIRSVVQLVRMCTDSSIWASDNIIVPTEEEVFEEYGNLNKSDSEMYRQE